MAPYNTNVCSGSKYLALNITIRLNFSSFIRNGIVLLIYQRLISTSVLKGNAKSFDLKSVKNKVCKNFPELELENC